MLGRGFEEEHGDIGTRSFFEHGFARIERMFFCDGVAKFRGNPGDPCSREKNYVVY
jgi:hypothetical protein